MNRLNTIYYRFQSEKKKYSINFNTTEISIGDIKKEIVRRRNLEKVPEKIELIFYNENNEEIRDDNIKINPLQMLCIKRIPSYKTFANFVEIVRDPSDISSSKFGDMNFLMHQKTEKNTIHTYDPIEKIIPKINFDILKKKFSCNICGNTEDKFYILSCCGETICEKCKIRMENTNETCKACDEKPRLFMPNNPIGEFKDRIISIIQRKKAKAEEEAEAIMKMNTANQTVGAMGQVPAQINVSSMVKGNSIDERLNEKIKSLGMDNIGAASQQSNIANISQGGNYNIGGKAYGNYGKYKFSNLFHYLFSLYFYKS